MQIKEDGRKRKLTIKDVKVTDLGLYSCVSNADKTEAEIVIMCMYNQTSSSIYPRCLTLVIMAIT